MNQDSGQARAQNFTVIAQTYMDSIYNYARYMVFDNEEAADITQKTFLALYQNLSKIQPQSTKAWLYKTARNNCLDYFKKKKMLNFSQVEDQTELEIPENYHSIEEQLDSSMYLDKVKEIVKNLPQDIKEVLLLKYFEDFTFEQIAETLNMPLNTVKSNFYRGKARVFNFLREQ